MVEIINTLTERLEQYLDDITDCCGDHELFAELEGRIDELRFVLDLLCPKDVIKINKGS